VTVGREMVDVHDHLRPSSVRCIGNALRLGSCIHQSRLLGSLWRHRRRRRPGLTAAACASACARRRQARGPLPFSGLRYCHLRALRRWRLEMQSDDEGTDFEVEQQIEDAGTTTLQRLQQLVQKRLQARLFYGILRCPMADEDRRPAGGIGWSAIFRHRRERIGLPPNSVTCSLPSRRSGLTDIAPARGRQWARRVPAGRQSRPSGTAGRCHRLML
jgi:hypothetical protein